MLLPGIHWQWLQVCLVWALFTWLLFYILKQTMFEDGEEAIDEDE